MAFLGENMETVELSYGQSLYEPHKAVDYLYFPEDSMISLISETKDGLTVEVGVVGCEGFVGAGAILERNTIPYRATVQSGGKAHKIRVKAARKAFSNAGAFQQQLLSYFLVVHTQIAQSAICNMFHTVQERMAKWLLLSVDRTEKSTFAYTQEFLAMILGARRTTISRTLKSLEALGLIRTKRASVTVLQKGQLEAVACECYEIIRAELHQL